MDDRPFKIFIGCLSLNKQININIFKILLNGKHFIIINIIINLNICV